MEQEQSYLAPRLEGRIFTYDEQVMQSDSMLVSVMDALWGRPYLIGTLTLSAVLVGSYLFFKKR